MHNAIEGAFAVTMCLLVLLAIGISIGQYFRHKGKRELLPEPAEDSRSWQRDFKRYLDQ